MSLSFLADVLHLLLLSAILQCVGAAGGMDNGSFSNSKNHAVFEFIGEYREDIDPHSNFCQPPDRLIRFKTDSSALQPYERKLRVCPLPKTDQITTQMFQHHKLLKYCFFEVNEDQTFCENEAKPYLKKVDRYGTLLCRIAESQTLYTIGSAICFPFVKGENNSTTYKKGLQGFLDYADKGVENTIQETFLYQLCYNNENNRTEWAQWGATYLKNRQFRFDTKIELSTDGFDLEGNKFEKMRIAFENQDNTSPDAMVPQMLAPQEESSYLLWKINTSHYINVAPLWKFLVPLMNLIKKRILLLNHRFDEILEVRTHNFYDESMENATTTYLDKDEEILIPNIWMITVFKPSSESGIAIVLHNTPNTPPISNEMCKEAASCDFQKWISTSTTQSFGNVTDEHTRYAYCCKTNKFVGLRNRSAIDMNFEEKNAQN